MNVLFVSSEVAPWSKTGGLGDVSGALPPALAAIGHDVVVVTPLYGNVKREGIVPLGRTVPLSFPFGTVELGLHWTDVSEGCGVLFLDCPPLFGRRGIYTDAHGDFRDNHRRFAALAVGALAAAEALGFEADIVHANDWPTGLTPLALRRGFSRGSLARARSVFTIHNLAYQGLFSAGVMGELGLPAELFNVEGVEHHNALSFMKAGLTRADALTTVSPGYAREIQTPKHGAGLEGLLRRRSNALVGILNGVDYGEWNPGTDPHLPARYSLEDLSGKRACKRALMERFGLWGPGAAERPLFGVVSRLADQKGIDLWLSALPDALRADIAVVILGSGDRHLEGTMGHLAYHFRGRVGVHVGFDAGLAHLIEAGSDFFVMPSRYEPCGLNQLYSLKYGTVPVVHATGGLDDTVVDVSRPDGTGIKFGDLGTDALLHAVWRSLQLYARPQLLDEVRRRGMAQDFSWEVSARTYEALYRRL